MLISLKQVKVGSVFKFKTADRRVVGFGEKMKTGFNVHWEYADGKKRSGRLGGSMWIHYFVKDAIEEVGVPKPVPAFKGKLQAYMPFDPETKTPYLNSVGSDPKEAEANLAMLDISEAILSRIKIIPIDITHALNHTQI